MSTSKDEPRKVSPDRGANLTRVDLHHALAMAAWWRRCPNPDANVEGLSPDECREDWLRRAWELRGALRLVGR